MFVYGGDSKTYDVDISIIQYMTFTLPHQQIFIDISNFVIFFYQCREPSLVSCLLSLVSVSCLLSPVSCPLSPVSRLPCCTVSAADLIYNDKADLAILWSKFVDLGNLAS